ncbi:MAG: RNA-binding transcriptional accessory protein [Methylococcaceae bacterium]|nr:MAG: RNA-binding transcriptional accessory protein [Methylococcaceae bacterium]
MNITARIAQELNVAARQVDAAIKLLDEGATVPFISRYRKEATEGLDDTQLRTLEERLYYLRELNARRETILASIREQGKLTPELEQAILAADTKTVLEDIYLPYKPKRRTKAQIAREAGLEPLADSLLADPALDPQSEAAKYLDEEKGVPDTDTALEGAKQILMERFAEDAELTGRLREKLWSEAILTSRVVAGKEQEGAKFRDYFDYDEPLSQVPSHRALALLRGRNEDILRVDLLPGKEPDVAHQACEGLVAARFAVKNLGRPADAWLAEAVRFAWRIKLFTRIELDVTQRLREIAEEEAIRVFARNLKALLLAAPAGAKTTMGLDPGLRTGVKVAISDATGKVLDTATIYPHQPKNQWDQSIAILAHLAKQHGVKLISIGNGTASRETDQLAADLIKRHPELGLTKIVVSEAGASVYSASELAAKEFPDLDVSLRGAVSIARRLQDPLAELVKIEPKAIGVGQYQHDVNQSQLARSLDAVVEDCVNAVGVDVNTASVSLLRYVSGLTQTIAQNIVEARDAGGAFKTRQDLLKVPRLGPKTFEQAAGFLRISQGDNPLDASAVHPEAYPVVRKIMSDGGKDIREIIGNAALLRSMNADKYVDERFGLPTVTDILKELEKPGRDPRPEFKTATFKEDVQAISDLKPGMWLEGVVTNVANFGAFVDVGVHQDGLVHVSQLADKFVKDPHEVVKTGDVVNVWVQEVDVARKRISLSMKKQQDSQGASGNADSGIPPQSRRADSGPSHSRARTPSKSTPAPVARSTMGDLFAKAKAKS